MKHNFVIAIMIIAMAPLAGMGIDIYAPALPLLSETFHVSILATGITMTIYLVGYAIGLAVAGPLSDSLGRVKVLNVCLALYLVVTILIIFSPNISSFYVLRFLQGIAVAGPGVMCKVLITDYFSKEQIPKMSANKSIAWALGPVLAPFIGGFLTHHIGWEGSFIFLSIYALGLIILSYVFLRESNPNYVPLNIKTILDNYTMVLRHGRFVSLTLGNSLCYSILVIFSVSGPFLIQRHMGYSAIAYGNSLLLLGFCYFIGTTCSRFLLKFYSLQKIAQFGTMLMGVGFVMLIITAVFGIQSLVVILLCCGLGYLGLGLIFANLMASCIQVFPKNAGTATAVMNSGFVLGAGIMSVLAGLLPANSSLPLGIVFSVICGCVILIIMKYRLDAS